MNQFREVEPNSRPWEDLPQICPPHQFTYVQGAPHGLKPMHNSSGAHEKRHLLCPCSTCVHYSAIFHPSSRLENRSPSAFLRNPSCYFSGDRRSDFCLHSQRGEIRVSWPETLFKGRVCPNKSFNQNTTGGMSFSDCSILSVNICLAGFFYQFFVMFISYIS